MVEEQEKPKEPPGLALERHHLEVEIAQATHRRYEIDLTKLDAKSVRELRRFVRDIGDEIRRVKSDVKRQPWKYLH